MITEPSDLINQEVMIWVDTKYVSGKVIEVDYNYATVKYNNKHAEDVEVDVDYDEIYIPVGSLGITV